MRTLMREMWFRALMMLLYCLCVAAGAISLNLYNFALQDGWYREQGEMGFEDSRLCSQYVWLCLNSVEQNLRWLEDPTSDTLGGYGGKAFSYKIVDDTDDNAVTVDTTTEKSHFVTSTEVFLPGPEEAEEPAGESAYYASATETDTAQLKIAQEEEVPGHSYRIEGYVNLPVEPYDGCYREYYIFEHLYAFKDYYLPVWIPSIILAVVLFVFSMVAAVQEGRQGKTTLTGHIPFDVAVLVLYLGLAWAKTAFYELPEVYDAMSMVGVYSHTVDLICSLWMLLLCGVIAANQLANGSFGQRLLLRRLVRKVPAPVLVLGILGGHVLLMLLILAVDAFHNAWFILILFGFDAVLVPCILRWYVEEKRIRDAAAALAAGDLNYKVNTNKLHMVWKDLGQDLGRIGDGMALAVEEQMRSERMKTELITNVSHDLKTPLTSIINYIELLKDESLPDETRREYLDVLDRQGAKLKKLTEDVVEASKAVSGAVTVNAELFDVRELLQQSVGEYSERLAAAGLEPILHTPEQETYIMADARLLGRVLDNFITNVLKYAQQGTRAYFDLTVGEERTSIAVKNVSREALDIPAEELMERFVRGDSSRSTEGSGLGLSIARSLTELMGGEMVLTLDGDLFKVEVSFPNAAPPLLPAEPKSPPEETKTE